MKITYEHLYALWIVSGFGFVLSISVHLVELKKKKHFSSNLQPTSANPQHFTMKVTSTALTM